MESGLGGLLDVLASESADPQIKEDSVQLDAPPKATGRTKRKMRSTESLSSAAIAASGYDVNVDRLRKLCSDRKLPTRGVKAELIERLKGSDGEATSSPRASRLRSGGGVVSSSGGGQAKEQLDEEVRTALNARLLEWSAEYPDLPMPSRDDKVKWVEYWFSNRNRRQNRGKSASAKLRQKSQRNSKATTGSEGEVNWSEHERTLAGKQWAEMERQTERLLKQDGYLWFQQDKNSGKGARVEAAAAADAIFAVGENVHVQDRGGPAQGGPARIEVANSDGTYDVMYLLHRGRETKIEAAHIMKVASEDEAGAGRRKRSRAREPAKQRFDPDQEYAKPQLRTKADSPSKEEKSYNLSGPLDLHLIKNKVLARVYRCTKNADDIVDQCIDGHGLFPDWEALKADVQKMCTEAMEQEGAQDALPDTTPGSLQKEAKKILDLCTSFVSNFRERHYKEKKIISERRRDFLKAAKNRLAAFQGEWRQKPFPLRQYTPIDRYHAVEGLDEQQGASLLDELSTEQHGVLSYSYSYEDKVTEEKRRRQLARLAEKGVTEDAVISAEITAVLDNLVEHVAWDNCPQGDGLKERGMQVPEDLLEIPAWGIDSYTRRQVQFALEDKLKTIGEAGRTHWLERVLLPAINAQGEQGWDMRLALVSIISRPVGGGTPAWHAEGARAVLEELEKTQEDYRVHPKGTGVICRREEGIQPNEYITQYLGELVPPWRWFEKQEAVEKAQQHFKKKPTLPDFYNMLMERHRDDSRGYSVIYIDASERNNFASSLSHSCDPNCRTTVAAIKNKYCVCLYSVRHISEGEELTIDYSAATESEEEYRAAVCLCGACKCRESFLYFTGADDCQQVLKRQHSMIDRFAQLVLASSKTQLLIPVQEVMNRHGLRSLAVGGMPEWLHKFVALALAFVDKEREDLPLELLRAHLQRLKPGEADDRAAVYKSADVESRQMLEQRVQNLAISLSRIRYFISNQLKLVTAPVEEGGFGGLLPPFPSPNGALALNAPFPVHHRRWVPPAERRQKAARDLARRKAAEEEANAAATMAISETISSPRIATPGAASAIMRLSLGGGSAPSGAAGASRPDLESDGAPPKAVKCEKWSAEEKSRLFELVAAEGPANWAEKRAHFGESRTAASLSSLWQRLRHSAEGVNAVAAYCATSGKQPSHFGGPAALEVELRADDVPADDRALGSMPLSPAPGGPVASPATLARSNSAQERGEAASVLSCLADAMGGMAASPRPEDGARAAAVAAAMAAAADAEPAAAPELPSQHCPVCSRPYGGEVMPRELNGCGHAVCEACLLRLLAPLIQAGTSASLSCPVCATLIDATLKKEKKKKKKKKKKKRPTPKSLSSGPPPAKKPRDGERRKPPVEWTDAERALLLELVDRDGPCKWGEKATAIQKACASSGALRSSSSVSNQWYDKICKTEQGLRVAARHPARAPRKPRMTVKLQKQQEALAAQAALSLLGQAGEADSAGAASNFWNEGEGELRLRGSGYEKPEKQAGVAAADSGRSRRARNVSSTQRYDPAVAAAAEKKATAKEPKRSAMPELGAVQAKSGVGYTAEEDETPQSIAAKLNIDVSELVALNKPRYKSMTKVRKLKRGTVLLIPSTSDYGGSAASDTNSPLHAQPLKPCTTIADIPPPLHTLTDLEIVNVLWAGQRSVARRLLRLASAGLEKQRVAEKPLGKVKLEKGEKSLRAMENLIEGTVVRTLQDCMTSLTGLRDLLRELPSTREVQHDAAVDLLSIYIHTQTFFTAQPYEEFDGSEVAVRARDIDGVLLARDKAASAPAGAPASPDAEEPKLADGTAESFVEHGEVVYQHAKHYRGDFVLSQIIGWYSQEKADSRLPHVSEIMGAVLSPDVAAACTPIQPTQPTHLVARLVR